MPTRPEYDRNALARQMIVGAHNVVVAFDLVVYVVHARAAAWCESYGMMYGINTHQSDVADTVTDSGVADLCPEQLIAYRIRRKQTDMAEARDARVTSSEVASSAALRANDKFDVVTGGVVEANEGFDLALVALVRCPDMHIVTKRLERRPCRLQLVLVDHLKRYGLIAGVSLEITKGMGAIVGAKVKRLR